MARGGRDEVRGDERGAVPRASGARRWQREPASDRRPGVPMDRLTLPREQTRDAVRVRGHVYHVRKTEARILATVGTFRVVRADDLQPMRSSRDAWTGDLRSLAEQGLVETRTIDINRESTSVVVLTRAGKDVLDAHQPRTDRPAQTFYVGLVKPRELAHDAQLYRLYQAEAARLEDEGHRVTRVVLDYELKRDYQTFLNRPDRPEAADRADDVAAFAAATGLPVVEGHLELPDLRIEYETADGRTEYRDVELVTEHYSRSQLAGKHAAGFALYRAAGAGRLRGGTTKTGGTPFDPHHLEWLR